MMQCLKNQNSINQKGTVRQCSGKKISSQQNAQHCKVIKKKEHDDIRCKASGQNGPHTGKSGSFCNTDSHSKQKIQPIGNGKDQNSCQIIAEKQCFSSYRKAVIKVCFLSGI